jgi:TPR repeat protein
MKYFLSLLTFAILAPASIAQTILDSRTSTPQGMEKKSTCSGARTPDEQFTLALSHKGNGKEEEMVACLQPAAEAGHAAAQELLGTSYGMGKGGLPMTTVFAEFWYCKSLDNGNNNAARGLGLLMSGTLYSLERMELMKTPGYKHRLCDYDALEKLKQNDPSKVFENAARLLQKKDGGG